MQPITHTAKNSSTEVREYTLDSGVSMLHVWVDGQHTGNVYSAANDAERDELVDTILGN